MEKIALPYKPIHEPSRSGSFFSLRSKAGAGTSGPDIPGKEQSFAIHAAFRCPPTDAPILADAAFPDEHRSFSLIYNRLRLKFLRNRQEHRRTQRGRPFRAIPGLFPPNPTVAGPCIHPTRIHKPAGSKTPGGITGSRPPPASESRRMIFAFRIHENRMRRVPGGR